MSFTVRPGRQLAAVRVDILQAMALKAVQAKGIAAYDGLFRFKNRRKRRVLIYTDSRGLNLTRRINAHHFGGHVDLLRKHLNVSYVVCPFSHTTLLDFLNHVATLRTDDFDAVIMQCGVVDFSPRPLSNIAKIRAGKVDEPGFNELFSANASYHERPWNVLFEGEQTISLYSQSYLQACILPRLQAIPGLVWVSSNNFVPGWEGNFERGRPTNINDVVGRFDDTMKTALPRVVDLHQWSSAEVQEFTVDNVHFSRAGFRRLAEILRMQVV